MVSKTGGNPSPHHPAAILYHHHRHPITALRPCQTSSAAANATAAVVMVSFFSSLPVVAGGKGRGQGERQGHTVAAAPIANEVLAWGQVTRCSHSRRCSPPSPSPGPLSSIIVTLSLSPPRRRRCRTRPRRPLPHMMLVFKQFPPKRVPFEDTTEAVVTFAVRGDGRWGGEMGWVFCGWRGGVGGVVGGFWSTRTQPYFSLICSHSFLLHRIFSSTKIR
jgi:hypothetical protein